MIVTKTQWRKSHNRFYVHYTENGENCAVGVTPEMIVRQNDIADQSKEIAALAAENAKLREALGDMLHIFDRDLPSGTVGRITCDKAIEALKVAK